MRRAAVLIFLLIAVLLLGWRQGWLHSSSVASSKVPETAVPIIDKAPVEFAQHRFDPAAPPAEMPPLGEGEAAECDSSFVSSASVAGRMEKLDASHATVTIRQVKITLQLKINIWVPESATQKVLDHEEGHRQISEYYYQSADKLAEQVASKYHGKEISVSGADLDAEFARALQELSAEITAEYNRQLVTSRAQQRYDDLTDHSRNDVAVKDAVDQAIKETN
jgi:hypothetical protein